MEIIRGKRTSILDEVTFIKTTQRYHCVQLDLGTGDGRFVRELALARPTNLIIGVDAARENLVEGSRRAPSNALFVIANAETLPHALHGLVTHITINFPWGSLLSGLLTPGSAVYAGLSAAARPGAQVDIRLNAGALTAAGWTLEEGTAQVRALLADHRFVTKPTDSLNADDLLALPSTWAKRLAFGRDPRAVYLAAVLAADGDTHFRRELRRVV